MNTEHAKSQRCELVCMHCEQEQTLAPMPVACLVDVVRGFLLMHRRCEKPVEPSKQVQMFDEMQKREATKWREIPIICAVCNGPLKDGEDPLTHLDQCRRKARDAAEMETEDECSARTVREEMAAAGHEPAGIDAATDDPAPEIDPPVDDYAKFYAMYPFAQDTPQLRELLGTVLTLAQIGRLNAQPLPSPDTAAFQYIAAWTRIECAHVDSEARGISGAIGGLTIPARLPMPDALKKLIEPQKKKRGARPLANSKPKKRASRPRPE